MSDKNFTASIVVGMLLSFFTFNSYTNYELVHSKIERYKTQNSKHSKRVNVRSVSSFEGISELNALHNQSKNLKFKILYSNDLNENLIRSESKEYLEVSELQTPVETRINSNIEPMVQSSEIAFDDFEQNENLKFENSKELEYALEPTKDRLLDYYIGVAVSGSVGRSNYFNPNQAENFTANIFEEHTSTKANGANESMVIGIGGQVFGGVVLKNGFSFETGIGYSQVTGNATYNFEHNYIREIERLEWIILSEDDIEAVVSKDYIESVALDTVTTSFSRNIVQIPLTINYNFDIGRIKPFVSIGASVNVTSNGFQNIYSSFQNKMLVNEESQGISQVNFHAGVGVDFEISNRFNARVKPAINVGVWNNNPDYMNGNLKDLSLQTGLYYKF